jgi:hypothetical protein
MPTNSIKNCTIQIIQAITFTKFHQYGISWPVD